MTRKVTIIQNVKRRKERPFLDEDTEIQIRHDYVRVYCLEPLDRKAKEEPVIERVMEKPIIDDYEIQDEDSDTGVQTRPRYLPQMPTHLPFLAGMKNADDPLQTRDLEMCLRYYNDAIRSNKEMGKIFLLGMIRQLRYWTKSQKIRPDVPDDQSALLYVRDELIPLIKADFKNVARYLTPETDLELFRRIYLETDALITEINIKLSDLTSTREKLEEEGFDPLEPEAPQFIELPSDGIIQWILENPDLAKITLKNPKQRDELIFRAWKEMFRANGVLEFLSLQDKLSQLMQFDFQRKTQLKHLQDLMKKSNVEELTEQLERPENQSIRQEFLQALNISKSIGRLDLLQNLEALYDSSGNFLPEVVITEPETFVNLLLTQGTPL